jgi:hypothetical protein
MESGMAPSLLVLLLQCPADAGDCPPSFASPELVAEGEGVDHALHLRLRVIRWQDHDSLLLESSMWFDSDRNPWVIDHREPINVYFIDKKGAEIRRSAQSMWILFTERFDRESVGWSACQDSVVVPTNARFLRAEFGNSGLTTSLIRIPR